MVTSEERHEARYQRRRRARLSRRAAVAAQADDHEKVFSYENLYAAYKKCRRNVSWKASVQKYITEAPLMVYETWERLQKGTYKSPPFFEFDVFERGKKRHIRSTTIHERVVQAALCENALIPMLCRSFIYDNGACRKKKGYDHALRRMVCCVERHIREHGTTGAILLADASKFFDSIPHRVVDELMDKTFHDERIVTLTKRMVHQFDEAAEPGCGIGLGLGSPISQTFAPAALDRLDHHIKDALGIKGYVRYMDDFFVLGEDKDVLRALVSDIRAQMGHVGMKLNERKTGVVPLRDTFTWLKVRVDITETGGKSLRIARSSVTRQRRRLKKLAAKVRCGAMSAARIENSMQSWWAHAKRFRSRRTRGSMAALYQDLFGVPWKGGNG